MKLFRRNHKETKFMTFRKNNLENKSWYFFRWEVGIIIFGAIIVSTMNVIPQLLGSSGEPIYFKNGDKYVPQLLRDNILFSSISISITIIGAVFIGVYTEIGQYAGKYSSSLFMLVPSLVWLLSDRADNHIEHLTESANLLGYIIFYSVMAVAGLFSITWITTKIAFANIRSHNLRIKWAIINNIVNRICVVVINILLLFTLGYGLVNFGIFTLHLGDISKAAQERIFNETGVNPGPYNLHSENFTAFIAVVAIVFALLMVAIGLSNVFTSKQAVAVDDEFASTDNNILTVSEINAKALENYQRLKEADDDEDDDVDDDVEKKEGDDYYGK